jgi:hypothetical protein
LKGDKNWLAEGFLVPTKKNKKRIVEEGSSSVAQDEGLHIKLINNHMEGFQCHHHMKEVCQIQVWGSGAAMPPRPPPYMFLTKFSRRTIQQMQEEGTTNIAYQIGRLHHWSNLEEGRHNHNTSNDTTRRIININHRKIKEEGGRKENKNAFKFGLIFSFSFSFFQLLCKFIYV